MNRKDHALLNKRILVTRAKEQAIEFSKQIRSYGGTPVEIPLISIQRSKNKEEIKKTIEQLNSYDWITFTSTNGVKFFFEAFEEYSSQPWEDITRPHIAVVGKKTLQKLSKLGIEVDLIPDQYDGDHLLEKFLEELKPEENVLLARGNLARNDLPKQLLERGVNVKDLVIYDTLLNTNVQQKLYQAIVNKEVDLITFTSSSTVIHFIELLKDTKWQSYIDRVTVACIGPITAETAKLHNIRVDIIPREYTITGLMKAMITFIQEEE